MTSDPQQFDNSVRDGFFDGSADDFQDRSVRDGIFDGSIDDLEDLDDGHHGHHRFPPFPRSSEGSGRHDVSGAPVWVKVLLWTGTLVALAGMGIVVFGLLGAFDGPDPASTRLTPAFPTADIPADFPVEALPPEFQTTARAFPVPGQHPSPSVGGPNLGLGFGLFFAGFVLSAIAGLGHSTAKRR
ncbi:hypothetical protein [Lentzea sp. NPDC055074]